MGKDKRERRDHHNSLIESEIAIRNYNTAYGLRKAREFWRAFYDYWREMESAEDDRVNGGFRRFSHKTRLLTDERDYKHWWRSLKKGQLISACYDGKRGRAVDARVVKSRKGVVIAEFTRWVGEGVARVRFVDGRGWDNGGVAMRAMGVSRRGDYYQIIPHIQHNPQDTIEESRVNLLTFATYMKRHFRTGPHLKYLCAALERVERGETLLWLL